MMMPAFFAENALWVNGSGIVILFFIVACCAAYFSRFLLYIVLAGFLGALYFFRFPHRECVSTKDDSTIIVCPADGRIVDIQHQDAIELEGYYWKIAIFLSPMDVHVNWIPAPGLIDRIVYRPGTFLPAFVPKSSVFNERCDVHVRCNAQRSYIIRQIAGAVARRIVCWVCEGDSVKFGDTYGMIRFGSRVELLLPEHVTLEVGIGQRVYGGSTVLGRWL